MNRRQIALIILLGFILSTQALANVGFIPPSSAYVDWIVRMATAGSIWAIPFFALGENTVGINAYLPLSIGVLDGMGATHGNPMKAVGVFALIFGASFWGQNITYLMGRLAQDRKSMQADVVTPGNDFIVALMSYWHPIFGSEYTYRSALEGKSYRNFIGEYSTAGLVWTAFWGILMYRIGIVPLKATSLVWIFCVYLCWRIFAERSERIKVGQQ
jgi:hypothetical protein